MNYIIVNLLLLIVLQFFIPSYGLAQDINIENKILELIKRVKIEKEVKSGIKDFYIGRRLTDPTAVKLEQGSGEECEWESDFNATPSQYAKEFELNQTSFQFLRNHHNYIICKTTVFGSENNISFGGITTVNKGSTEFVILLMAIKFQNKDRELVNSAMIEKWGNPVKKLKTSDKSNPQICQEIAPVEIWGQKQFQRCIKKLNDNPILSRLNPTSSNSLLFESVNSYAELTHYHNRSILVIQHKNTDAIIESIANIYRENENKIESQRKNKLLKDF
jgi:hypothetical protein